MENEKIPHVELSRDIIKSSQISDFLSRKIVNELNKLGIDGCYPEFTYYKVGVMCGLMITFKRNLNYLLYKRDYSIVQGKGDIRNMANNSLADFIKSILFDSHSFKNFKRHTFENDIEFSNIIFSTPVYLGFAHRVLEVVTVDLLKVFQLMVAERFEPDKKIGVIVESFEPEIDNPYGGFEFNIVSCDNTELIERRRFIIEQRLKHQAKMVGSLKPDEYVGGGVYKHHRCKTRQQLEDQEKM